MRVSKRARVLRRVPIPARVPRLCLTYCIAAVLLAIAPAICAEEEAARIPVDGAWVRYQMETEQSENDENKFEASVTLSLVGTVTEDGLRCRWLESKMDVRKTPATAGTSISKVLVPQEDLFESTKPFERARRLWISRPKAPPTKFDIAKVGNWISWEENLLWSPGMLKSARRLEDEPRIVEYQRGQLKCIHAFSGELTYVTPGPGDLKITNKRKYTLWLHPQVPFGFAEARIQGEQTLGENTSRFTTIYSLQDFGDDAKSALPENN